MIELKCPKCGLGNVAKDNLFGIMKKDDAKANPLPLVRETAG